jgi:hypothetical protein
VSSSFRFSIVFIAMIPAWRMLCIVVYLSTWFGELGGSGVWL